MRTCALPWCQTSLEQRRRDCVYCSASCRSRARHHRNELSVRRRASEAQDALPSGLRTFTEDLARVQARALRAGVEMTIRMRPYPVDHDARTVTEPARQSRPVGQEVRERECDDPPNSSTAPRPSRMPWRVLTRRLPAVRQPDDQGRPQPRRSCRGSARAGRRPRRGEDQSLGASFGSPQQMRYSTFSSGSSARSSFISWSKKPPTGTAPRPSAPAQRQKFWPAWPASTRMCR
jgi:hypothetical protein